MAELRSEEEQLDAIKRWWKSNGTSLIIGVVVAAAGVFAWKAWQNYQDSQAEAASAQYQQLLALAGQQGLGDEALSRAEGLIDTLVNDYGDTRYAELATLIQARLEIVDGDLAGASQALQRVIDGDADDYLKGLARLRLARIQLADGQPETALATLEAGIPEGLAAPRAIARGDALVALARNDEARKAYQQALTLSRESEQPVYGVQLKLDNLGAEDATL
ncbi:MAG: tetratricopeptide repeat protein [Pseudomonadota bacterium]|nr:tetratricopeptide repeat protein [Pseudomonadota bacterium]